LKRSGSAHRLNPSRRDAGPAGLRRRFLQKLVEALRDAGADLSSIGKACTCGDPRRHGPCPRHGKLY
jgi:hypothetical protein